MLAWVGGYALSRVLKHGHQARLTSIVLVMPACLLHQGSAPSVQLRGGAQPVHYYCVAYLRAALLVS